MPANMRAKIAAPAGNEDLHKIKKLDIVKVKPIKFYRATAKNRNLTNSSAIRLQCRTNIKHAAGVQSFRRKAGKAHAGSHLIKRRRQHFFGGCSPISSMAGL